MDFATTAHERELQERYHHVGVVVREALDRGEPVESCWPMLGDAGLLALPLPADRCGDSRSALHTAIAFEAFGRGVRDAGAVLAVGAHVFACAMPIALHGGDLLRDEFAEGLAKGEEIGANAITEPTGGSDPFANMATHAFADGDHYRLTGRKCFVTNGPSARIVVTYASTSPADGFLGITAFAVRSDAPGVLIGAPLKKVGLRSARACEIVLEDHRVPAESRLGEEGSGSRIFADAMNWERVGVFAGVVGILDDQLSRTLEFLRARLRRGVPLSAHPVVAQRIADMKCRLEASRLMVLRAADAIDRGERPRLHAALAKLLVSEAAVSSGIDAVHLHGSSGILEESEAATWVADATPGTLYSGTNEVLRELVTREVLE